MCLCYVWLGYCCCFFSSSLCHTIKAALLAFIFLFVDNVFFHSFFFYLDGNGLDFKWTIHCTASCCCSPTFFYIFIFVFLMFFFHKQSGKFQWNRDRIKNERWLFQISRNKKVCFFFVADVVVVVKQNENKKMNHKNEH